MKGDVVFAHGESIEMFETFCKLVSVSVAGDETECFFIVDAFVERES